MSGWDHPQTAAYYEAFCRAHSRYRAANAALIRHARIEPAHRVLDLAAGTGRTAEAALEKLGASGRIVCVEPSPAMRAEGMRRISGTRVRWAATLDQADGRFHRILCGAAIWQMEPVPETLRTLTALLHPGGALCFNIPALYLLEPDEPGGGSDPLLLALPVLLMRSAESTPGQGSAPLSIPAWLRAAGLRARSWRFRVRLTQDAYASWLKIPVLTERLFGGLAADERAHRIDAALDSVDRSSWKWERWKGWTAWKP